MAEGERCVGRSAVSRYKEFHDEGLRAGYDRGDEQSINVMHMVQPMNQMGHLGVECVQDENDFKLCIRDRCFND